MTNSPSSLAASLTKIPLTSHIEGSSCHPLPEDAAQFDRQDRPFLAIDLFAGAGGLTQGFRDAGFKVVQAVEQDPAATATYTANHPDVDVICADIQTLDPIACLERINLACGEVSILIGGPPCQGFSESNRRTRTLANPKNHLYIDFLRFVTSVKPEWVVFENVAGLRTMERGVILSRILVALREAGYEAESCLLNSANHGVPQVRRRLFVIANRLNLPIPQKTDLVTLAKSDRITVRQAIADLPMLPNGASIDKLEYPSNPTSDYQRKMRQGVGKLVSGNLVTRNCAHIQQRYRHIPEGGNWKDIPVSLLSNYTDRTRCHTGIYHRLSWDLPAKVIGNFRKNMLVHPNQDRGLSVREAARLQGFPDTYHFTGTIGPSQQQVADAVPPLLAEAVAVAIFRSLVSAPQRFSPDPMTAALTVGTVSTSKESASISHTNDIP
ncbi:MAG: DNA cytosine methyltransferase [Bryobacterales bacterium]|nr:DNA cytosine methyltransferase [Bryobacterales bacterium]